MRWFFSWCNRPTAPCCRLDRRRRLQPVRSLYTHWQRLALPSGRTMSLSSAVLSSLSSSGRKLVTECLADCQTVARELPPLLELADAIINCEEPH